MCEIHLMYMCEPRASEKWEMRSKASEKDFFNLLLFPSFMSYITQSRVSVSQKRSTKNKLAASM